MTDGSYIKVDKKCTSPIVPFGKKLIEKGRCIMMSVLKSHFPTILTVCILVVMLVIVVCIVFFFNKMTIQVDSIEKLMELMRSDFTDVDITDIQCRYVKDKTL